MVLDFGRETLLYAVGIVLGVVAIAYFGFQLFDQVSPVTTAVALLAGFLVFLVAGVAVEAELLDVVAYGLAAGCYLVFVAYVLARFDVGDGGTFLLLTASSALFVGLGYLAQKGRLELSRRRAMLAVLVVTLHDARRRRCRRRRRGSECLHRVRRLRGSAGAGRHDDGGDRDAGEPVLPPAGG